MLAALLMAAALLALPRPARAAGETVKVGYMGAGGVRQEEDGSFTGYVVDYLEEIAAYTGWEYEYIFGSLSELVGQLETGELDLIGMVRYTEERADTLLYTDLSMAHDYTALFAPMDSEIYYQDYAAFDGCRIGVVAGAIHEEALKEYALEHGFSYEPAAFPATPEAESALMRGEIDLFATSGISSHPNQKEVDRFQLERTYLVTGQGNRALMDELNAAIQQARLENPAMEQELTERYFAPDHAAVDLRLTREEQAYLESVGPIVALGFAGWRPLGYHAGDGSFVGVASDYLDQVGAVSGLTFIHKEAGAAALPENAEQMLEEGCALVYVDQDLSALGLSGVLSKTEPLFETGLAYIKRQDDAGSTGRSDLVFAINREMAYLEPMLRAESASYRLLWFDDSTACLDAVVKGEADVAIQDEHVAAYLLQKPVFAENLREVAGGQMMNGMCLYAPKEHEHLIHILNKSLSAMTEVQKLNAMTDAMIAHSYEYGLTDMLYEHGSVILLVLILVAVAVALGFLLFIRVNTLRQRDKENRELQERVRTDELTGVYSRAYFLEKAREMIDESGGDICIVRLNVCYFKVVNELYGAEKGDHLLWEMGRDLKALSEKMGFAVGRFNSDHFYLCIRREDFESIGFPQRAPAPWLGMDITLTYGVYPVGGQKDIPVSVMCDRANMANAASRASATDYIGYYSDAAYQQLLRDQEIEHEMEQALAERQFFICVQPKFNIETERITGGEALVRWRHPEKGLIPPGEFVPLFERNGFIRELDYYVWEECCRFQAGQRAKGRKPVPLSMNVSRIHFYSSDLVGKLSGLLEQYGLDAADLELEITESVCSDDPEIIFSKCRTLREMGFQIAMDDFGSGYSSLNMLKEMPLDVIKMDLRFLTGAADAGQREKGNSILRSLVDLAHSLELKVVVEGLETAEQRDFIRRIGNCAAQGYFYSRPVDCESYESMLMAGKAPERA